MGKSSLIIVLGMAGIISLLMMKMNANSKENLSATVNMFEQTQARLIANTGVEIYLEKLYADTTLINTTSSSHDLFNGSYVVNLSGTLPNVRVTSTSDFQGVQHISVADAFLEPITFPVLPSGMYISTESVSNAKLNGDMQINGSNHDVDGNIKGTGLPAVYGIGVDTEADKNSVLASIKNPEKVKGLIDSTGTIGYPSVEITNLGINWSMIYQYLANSADQTFIGDIPNGADLGTLNNPLITLINAEASSESAISISQTTGAGIMIVNGSVSFEGNFEYKGIILCYKNTAMTFSAAGTNRILGGIIIAGKLVEITTTGTMNVDYSLDVINAVKTNLKSNGYKILSWYE
jgi:hypothetical protein